MLYDVKFLKKYLNGEEIKNIDRVESDPEFIYEATMISRDRNMYNLWDDKMKSNYLFVRRMVYRFKNDIDFIDNVASSYLKWNKVDENFFELCIIMRNFCLGADVELFKKYDLLCMNVYNEYMYEINREKMPSSMGFDVVLRHFKSKIVLDYVALKFVDEIINGKKQDSACISSIVEKRDASLNDYLFADKKDKKLSLRKEKNNGN